MQELSHNTTTKYITMNVAHSPIWRDGWVC